MNIPIFEYVHNLIDAIIISTTSKNIQQLVISNLQFK